MPFYPRAGTIPATLNWSVIPGHPSTLRLLWPDDEPVPSWTVQIEGGGSVMTSTEDQMMCVSLNAEQTTTAVGRSWLLVDGDGDPQIGGDVVRWMGGNTPSSSFQLSTGGTSVTVALAAAGPAGPASTVPGPAGPAGPAFNPNGLVPSSTDLPDLGTVGDFLVAEDTGHGWVWVQDDLEWLDLGLVRGPQGAASTVPGPDGPQGAPGGDVVGMSKAPRGLSRWRLSPRAQRHIVCFGDSMLQGGGISGKTHGPPDYLRTVLRNEWGVPVHDGFQPIRWAEPVGGVAYRWAKDAGWTNAGLTASNMSPSGAAFSAIRSTSGVRSLTWTRPTDVQVAQVIVFWVDDAATNVGGWSYSTTGSGGPWTTVTPTAPGTPTLKVTTVNVSNPTDFRIRSANAAGTGYASPVFLGIDIRGDLLNTGWVVHNFGYSGGFLAGTAAANSGANIAPERVGDFGVLFDAYQPELVVFGITNDAVAAQYDLARFDTAVNTLVSRVSGYADLIAYGFPEQNVGAAGRSVANQDSLRASVAAKFIAAGGGSVDFKARWGSQAAASALGLMETGFFPIHPSEAGDKDIGATLGRFLRVFA